MNMKHIAAVPTMMAIVAAVQPALATDITIADGQTETATQSLSGAGATLTIETGGAVSSGGDDGVVFGAKGQSLVNHGTIHTNGSPAYGVTNNWDNVRVENHGEIRTLGICSYGVYSVADHFTFTNNGVVATEASDNSWAIGFEGANATIINNGSVQTVGDGATAISVWDSRNATVINNGTISVSGTDTFAVYAYHNKADGPSRSVLINNGTIRATGEQGAGSYSQGVFANSVGMSVINSGTIYSERAESIVLNADDQTLTLLAGSELHGVVKFAKPTTATLNIGRGLDATLTLDGIPDTINPNGQLLVIDRAEGRVAVVSPEIARGGSAAATATSGAVSNAINTRIAKGRNNALSGGSAPGSLVSAYAPTGAAASFPNFAPSDKFGAWASAYGAYSAPTGGRTGSRTVQGGALFGFDARLSADRIAGLFAGFGHGVVKAGNGSEVETTTIVGGAYGSYDLGAVFVDVNASIGATFNDSSRRVMDNFTGITEIATASYNGFFFSPSVAVGYDHDLGSARLTPILSLTYAGVYQNAYAESGATANLSLGSQTSHALTARGEIELGTLKAADMRNGWRGSVKLGAEGTYISSGSTSASLMGSSATMSGATSTQARGFLGADVGYVRDGYALTAQGEVGYSSEGAISASLQGGIAVRF